MRNVRLLARCSGNRGSIVFAVHPTRFWIAASLRCHFRILILHLRSHTYPSTTQPVRQAGARWRKMEPPAIKVNSEMYDFKLRYFLATEEWQWRGWVHPAGAFELPDCLTDFTRLVPAWKAHRGGGGRGVWLLASVTTHHAAASPQQVEGGRGGLFM